MSDSWIDQGCWNDNKTGARAIPNQAPTTKTYNFSTCRNYAEQEDANTFALQYGGQCFYGKDSDYQQPGKVSQCPMSGGAWINHVYTQASAPITWDDKGCWIDSQERMIPNAAPGGGVYSVGSCKAYALSENADTIGLQYPTSTGSSCYYGNTPDYTKLGEASGTCDPDGGIWTNHVYTIPPTPEEEQVPSNTTTDPPSDTQPPSSSSSSDKTRNIILGVLIGIVVLLFLIGLIVYFKRKNQTETLQSNI